MPRVELIYDRDCPSVGEARAQLLRAFADARLPASWLEWERSAPESPAYVRGFGSPTILVDGEDVFPLPPLDGAGCRLYPGTGSGRAPSAEAIAGKLRESLAKPARSKAAGWRDNLPVLPGLGVALLPNLACPACWPAYAALVSSAGLGFLIESKYLLWLTAAFLTLALAAIGHGAGARRGYGPFGLGVAAAVAVLLGKFVLNSSAVGYVGVGLLAAASFWNAWPRRLETATGCPICIGQPSPPAAVGGSKNQGGVS